LLAGNSGVAKIVIEAVQQMLLRVALQSARDNYEVRRKRGRGRIEVANREGRHSGRKAN
jgi:hypothetical protein